MNEIIAMEKASHLSTENSTISAISLIIAKPIIEMAPPRVIGENAVPKNSSIITKKTFIITKENAFRIRAAIDAIFPNTDVTTDGGESLAEQESTPDDVEQ